MNERIKEFIKASGLDNDAFPIDEYDNPELETFAKLIIQECIDNLSWHGHDDAVSQLYWLSENKLGIKL
jgi:hypothetical protein